MARLFSKDTEFLFTTFTSASKQGSSLQNSNLRAILFEITIYRNPFVVTGSRVYMSFECSCAFLKNFYFNISCTL